MNKLAALFVIMLCLGAGLHAQDVFATIEGTILDPADAAVPNAKMTVTNVDRNQAIRTLTSDSNGVYSATLLPIGNYSVKVEATGFKTETRTGIVLNVDDNLKLNIKLEVGAVTETSKCKEQSMQVELANATPAHHDRRHTGARTGTRHPKLSSSLVALMPGVAIKANPADELYIGNSCPPALRHRFLIP